MRFEVIKDFQYTNEKMQIMILPKGQLIEKYDQDTYVFKLKSKKYQIPAIIVENNPSFFKGVNWREDLLKEMKKNKRSTTAAIHKQVIEYIDTEVLFEKELVDYETMIELLELVKEKYNLTGDKYYLDLFDRVGWTFDENKIWKKF